MSQYNIKIACEKHAVALDNSFDTAYENVKFKPVSGTPYQVLGLYPYAPENPTFGDDYHREVGFFQVLLCYPVNQGYANISSKAEEVKEHFKRATTLTFGDTKVIINKTPEIGLPYVDGDRYCVPIRIPYYSNEF